MLVHEMPEFAELVQSFDQYFLFFMTHTVKLGLHFEIVFINKDILSEISIYFCGSLLHLLLVSATIDSLEEFLMVLNKHIAHLVRTWLSSMLALLA